MKRSAGILLYRIKKGEPEFFLVHYGGPFWAKKDLGNWSIPKGEFTEEDPLEAALREFKEETGTQLKPDSPIQLSPVRQKGGKTIIAFAVEGDIDPDKITSNEFEMEWPPRSGKKKFFPEIDKGNWFSEQEAELKVNPAQLSFIRELIQILKNKTR